MSAASGPGMVTWPSARLSEWRHHDGWTAGRSSARRRNVRSAWQLAQTRSHLAISARSAAMTDPNPAAAASNPGDGLPHRGSLTWNIFPLPGRWSSCITWIGYWRPQSAHGPSLASCRVSTSSRKACCRGVIASTLRRHDPAIGTMVRGGWREPDLSAVSNARRAAYYWPTRREHGLFDSDRRQRRG